MIEGHLNRMHLNPENQATLCRTMRSTTQLANTLQTYKSLQEVLMLLYTELSGQNRESYVDRIYSRYRVLSQARDKEAMKLWALKKKR